MQAITDDDKKRIKNDDENIKEEDKKMLNIIDKNDMAVLNYLDKLYEYINKDKLYLSKIRTSVDALASFNQRQEYNYLDNLLHPEKCKNVKIPSPIPVPSCAFQLHNSITVSTNSSGNLGIVFNPFFLASNTFTTKDIAIPDMPGDGPKATRINFLSSFFFK